MKPIVITCLTWLALVGSIVAEPRAYTVNRLLGAQVTNIRTGERVLLPFGTKVIWHAGPGDDVYDDDGLLSSTIAVHFNGSNFLTPTSYLKPEIPFRLKTSVKAGNFILNVWIGTSGSLDSCGKTSYCYTEVVTSAEGRFVRQLACLVPVPGSISDSNVMFLALYHPSAKENERYIFVLPDGKPRPVK